MKRDSGTHCDRSGETRHMFTHERRERERERERERPSDGDGGGRRGFDHLERKCRPGERLTNSRRRLESRLRIERVSETPRADGEREKEKEEPRRGRIPIIRPSVCPSVLPLVNQSFGAATSSPPPPPRSASLRPFAISLAPQTVHHTPTAQLRKLCYDQSAWEKR